MTTPRALAMPAAALALLALFSCSLPEPPPRVALVYGVSIYDDSKPEGSKPNLTSTDDDAIAVANMLIAQGWNPSDVRLMAYNNPVSEKITKQKIKTDIESISTFDGLVFLYFSGHGYFQVNTNTHYMFPKFFIFIGNIIQDSLIPIKK